VTGGRPGNGHFDPAGDDEADGLDDDAPLDPSEESAAAQEAGAEADETLDERVEMVIEDLGDVERVRDGESVTYLAGGRPFAVLLPDVLEVALAAAVATAALRTADTVASARGGGWIAFTPMTIDRFALDRAEAWVRSAHRRATGD
jgi:antitoxin (DNA-binding transcriptional repressor) of toxin-antitoxin stability system